MAAFRLLYFPPATSAFFHTHPFLPPPTLPPPTLSLLTKPQIFLVKHAQIRARTRTRTRANATIESESALENVAEKDERSNSRLLVQNVPWTFTVEDLRHHLEKFGTVVDIEFSMYNKTRNRGLAFVTMGSHEEAAAAIKGLDSTELEGRVLKLNWAVPKKPKMGSGSQPKPKPMPVHNLFVANLAFQARAKDVKEFFNAGNGKVVSAEVIFQDNPRRSSGYGFVSFNTKADAEAALAAFQGKEFMGRPLRVARSKRFLRQETKASLQSEAVCGKEALDLLNCIAQSPYDQQKCLSLLQALRHCVVDKKVKKFSLAEPTNKGAGLSGKKQN